MVADEESDRAVRHTRSRELRNRDFVLRPKRHDDVYAVYVLGA
jgi:hypothetical protein